MGIEGIGTRVARKEDKRFITGLGRYVDDMVVPGMKHAAFVRSPHAHAEIVSIDTTKAKDMPGVIGVLTVVYGVPLPEATAITILDWVISVLSIIVIGAVVYVVSPMPRGMGRISQPPTATSAPTAA